MKKIVNGLTAVVVVSIIIAFGFIRPTPVEASETAQIYLQSTPYLIVSTVACTAEKSHVQIQFQAKNIPADDEILSYGQVSFLLNGGSRVAPKSGRSGSTVRYNLFLSPPVNGIYTLADADVTIVTTTGSQALAWDGPQDFHVTNCNTTPTPTDSFTATPTATLTATPTSTDSVTSTPSPTATNTPTGTIDSTLTPTPTTTSEIPVTQTPTTDLPSPTPTLELTPTVYATPGPQFEQCVWVVPNQYVGGRYFVQRPGGGQQYGDTYPGIEYKEENGGATLWVMFDRNLAGMLAEIVYEPTGEILISFQFLANGEGNDRTGNCRTETQVSSGPTPTPVPSSCDVDCGSPKRETIPPSGAVIVNYYLCSNGATPPCGSMPLVEFTVYQSEIPFSVIVNDMKLDAEVVTNVRGDFYILDRIPTLLGRELVNPDGTPFNGPLTEYDACSVWPTFARLNGTTMQYWSLATRSDIGDWLREESGIVYETTFAFANALSQQPWPVLEVPAEILAGLAP